MRLYATRTRQTRTRNDQWADLKSIHRRFTKVERMLVSDDVYSRPAVLVSLNPIPFLLPCTPAEVNNLSSCLVAPSETHAVPKL